ncbi:GIY-YIG nuclease family protein [Streptomyces sp. f150]|uniref:GIY-YIG nuclease family protein n=1 Tax=Streptomyces sp. f150 TaxID=1827699 RepID=UPI000BF08918|nr:GIY-YIG nuclease family protein [Streptomyces sp. f150]
MAMRIYRATAEGGLSIPATLALDDRLTYAARGLLLDILARPEGWEANADELSRAARQARGDAAGEGRRAMRALFSELENAGYMRRLRMRANSGVFYTVLEVTDVPHRWGVAERGSRHWPRRGEGNVVYVIGDSRSGVVKIGTTSNLQRRLSGLQTGSAYELRVLWSFGGGAELEAHLHRRFADRQMVGEWFDFGDSDPVEAVMASTEIFYLVPTGTCASWS